jgi:hypothetical protein
VVRRLVWALVVVAIAVVAAGCSAADHVAVSVGEDGVPVVLNCGTWIERVEVSDADGGREIWSARARRAPNGDLDGVAALRVGTLPEPRWTEGRPLAIEPRPDRWAFRIDTVGGRSALEAVDADLSVDRVIRPGGATESRSRFDQQTCSGIAFSPFVGRLLAGVGIFVGGAFAAREVIRRRRSRRSGGVCRAGRVSACPSSSTSS